MVKDEALLIKIYDSDETVARGSLHTGFENQTALAAGAPPRESMEVRCIALWAPVEIASKATLRGVASNVQGGASGPAGSDQNGIYRAQQQLEESQ